VCGSAYHVYVLTPVLAELNKRYSDTKHLLTVILLLLMSCQYVTILLLATDVVFLIVSCAP